jgi:hypothetical protein
MIVDRPPPCCADDAANNRNPISVSRGTMILNIKSLLAKSHSSTNTLCGCQPRPAYEGKNGAMGGGAGGDKSMLEWGGNESGGGRRGDRIYANGGEELVSS